MGADINAKMLKAISLWEKVMIPWDSTASARISYSSN
jgi:hypothetical protein